jgi:hypothetical protein
MALGVGGRKTGPARRRYAVNDVACVGEAAALDQVERCGSVDRIDHDIRDWRKGARDNFSKGDVAN